MFQQDLYRQNDDGKIKINIIKSNNFLKHDLKGVLKCIRVKIWTPPPPHRP